MVSAVSQSKRVLLLGVGAPFCADRIGWLVADALAQSDLASRFPHLALRIEQSDRPGSRLIGLLESTDMAVIVDAMQSGAPAGTVRCFTPDELSATLDLASSHGFGVSDALALAGQLGALPAQVAIIGVEMGREEDGEPLLHAALAMVGATVRALLLAYSGEADRAAAE